MACHSRTDQEWSKVTIRAAFVPLFAGDRRKRRRIRAGIRRRARFTTVERGGGEIDILYQTRIDEPRRREAAADRGYPVHPFLGPEPVQDWSKIVVIQRVCVAPMVARGAPTRAVRHIRHQR